jgi:N-acetylmuramic acid 6-phosphate etherase
MSLFSLLKGMEGTDASVESKDYLDTKQQFQLHSLLTEQRHPKTWNLSADINRETLVGTTSLLSVDEDITNKFAEISENNQLHLLEKASLAVEKAILGGHKIYIYGCGATGRLAKQCESSFWRPIWKKVSPEVKSLFPDIDNRCPGEITGADRALISSLEGFEDLKLIGKLQLQDHGIQKHDVVICVTEGGETSSVIGTMLEAYSFYDREDKESKAEDHLFFVYNNPDVVLLPFDRSREVIENEDITKIRLFTGPQGITGSTRMQASTSETFIVGIIMEQAICNVLKTHYSEEIMLSQFGFDVSLTMKDRLLSFQSVQEALYSQAAAISQLTDIESEAYASHHHSTYYAQESIITVFTDSTERSPTFRLFPLDCCDTPSPERKSWIQVWTDATNKHDAWQRFLQRPFKGMTPDRYKEPFSTLIDDVYLRKAALDSLLKAGNEEQDLYDFSVSEGNVRTHPPREGDLGVVNLLAHEILFLTEEGSVLQTFLKLCHENKATLAIIIVCPLQQYKTSREAFQTTLQALCPSAILIHLPIEMANQDPLMIRQHIGLKMLLNAHSTGVMAKMGRVVSNTMTNVNPGNLKLIGRATFLILSHIVENLPSTSVFSYDEANAVLFSSIEYCNLSGKSGQNSEVGLSIIRVLETDKRGADVSWEEAEQLLVTEGLEHYLLRYKAEGV